MQKFFLLCALFFFIFPAQAVDTVQKKEENAITFDFANGSRIYKKNCATCHGRHGEKKAFGFSKLIKNLSQDDVVSALTRRKKGEIQGPGNPAKARLSEQEMQDVAAVVASFNP